MINVTDSLVNFKFCLIYPYFTVFEVKILIKN